MINQECYGSPIIIIIKLWPPPIPIVVPPSRPGVSLSTLDILRRPLLSAAKPQVKQNHYRKKYWT